MHDEPSDPFGDIEPPDWALVARYLAGEATAADAALLQAWVARDARHALWLEGLAHAWRAADRPAGRGVDRAALANAVWARVHGTARRRRPRVARWAQGVTVARSVIGLAAALVVAAGISLTVWRPGWFAPTARYRVFASAPGQRTAITLGDGTRIVLAPASRLRVPEAYGASDRTVELDGEALLTVVHDRQRPFAVRTATTTVRDIGTTFVVRAYAGDVAARVVVADGEVAVGRDVTLGARDAAVVDAAGRVAVTRHIDLARDWAWVRGDLVFADTPLRDVVRDVGRWYDVDVTIADSALGSKPITGTFHNEPVDEVLREITFAAGAHYERSGRAVVIRGGASSAGQPGHAAPAALRLTRAGATRCLSSCGALHTFTDKSE